MSTSIYLVNPKSSFPEYDGTDVSNELGLSACAWVADLASCTVAAMAPDDFEVTVCDENIESVDLASPADFVGLTGKAVQSGRMIELAQEFRRRGKIVIIGGPYASLSPDTVRPHCDILVRGEIEDIAPRFFSDLSGGDWKPEYVGGKPDLTKSPIPRWDLYPNDLALVGCVQTSRGCPFECEFCDVIQYAGRKQRHKSVQQVLAELDVIYRHGYSSVFLADDNFTVYRRRSKELLAALRDWNRRQPEGGLRFSTQLSIDTAREDEILQLCAEAGLEYVYIGIETPNEDSLRQSKKPQNVGIDMVERIQRFLDHGIAVTGGMIVGFDADGPDIFERQYQFAMATPVPNFTLGALVAPDATPLRARMQEANRLVEVDGYNTSSAGMAPWHTNIIPKGMTRGELLTGLRWLGNRLYQPSAFGQRMLQFIERYKPWPASISRFRTTRRKLDGEVLETIRDIQRLGPEEAEMFSEITRAVRDNPATQYHVLTGLHRYRQTRYMYDQGHFWEPRLTQQERPDFGEVPARVSMS